MRCTPVINNYSGQAAASPTGGRSTKADIRLGSTTALSTYIHNQRSCDGIRPCTFSAEKPNLVNMHHVKSSDPLDNDQSLRPTQPYCPSVCRRTYRSRQLQFNARPIEGKMCRECCIRSICSCKVLPLHNPNNIGDVIWSYDWCPQDPVNQRCLWPCCWLFQHSRITGMSYAAPSCDVVAGGRTINGGNGDAVERQTISRAHVSLHSSKHVSIFTWVRDVRIYQSGSQQSGGGILMSTRSKG